MRARRNPGVRVELTRADYARRGVVLVVAVAVALLLIAAASDGVIGGPDTITAQLARAGGSLTNGADVKMRGVIIGSVAGIDPGPHGGVRVTLDMDDDALARVPGNAVARVLPATVFGTSFVDLTTHGRPSPRTLRAGAVVPADRSQGTLELQQALDDIDGLVKALRPAQLSATLGAAARALDGRGEQLGTMIVGLDNLLGRAQPSIPVLHRDLEELSGNVALVRRIAPGLLDSVANSRSTLRTLAAQQADLTTLLASGVRLASSAERLLAADRGSLLSFLAGAAQVADIYLDLRHRAFTDSFRTLREVRKKAGTIVRFGWNNNLVALQSGTPDHYSPADCPRYGRAAGDNCPGRGRAPSAWMVGGALR